jgi:hypothetical protein
MSIIGQRFPQFALTGVVSSDPANAFQSFTHASFPGKWWHKGDETLKAA